MSNTSKDNIKINKPKYCNKCFSNLGDSAVKDHNGKWYCCAGCRSDNFMEERRERDSRYSEMFYRGDDY